jgi:hypothetical protein
MFDLPSSLVKGSRCELGRVRVLPGWQTPAFAPRSLTLFVQAMLKLRVNRNGAELGLNCDTIGNGVTVHYSH